jgi:hopanoid biosynthesis associated RND transporter like protein HpnN
VIALLATLVEFCQRRAWFVLGATLVLSGLAGTYAFHSLGVDTDTGKLFSPKLEWQQQKLAMQAAFPGDADQTTIVIDGVTAGAVEDGTAALAAALAERTDVFRSVHRPDGGPFFEQYGLMFLSVEDLSKLSDEIARAEPLLGPLDADPSPRGLFGLLDQAMQAVGAGQASGAEFNEPMMGIAQAVASVARGAPKPLDWDRLMTGDPPRPEQLRHFILVQPRLDYDALEPGARSSRVIRDTAAQLGLAEKGVRVRLTGDVPLEDDEFASVAEGAGTNTALALAAVVVILLFAFRAPRIIGAIVVTLLVGLLITAAFAAVAVGTLNMISVTFAVLFIGIAVDFSIQFSMRYRAELVAGGGGAEALIRAARGIAGPLAVAATATAVGFYSFVPTDYQGVSELGVIAGTSMIVALIANLTVLPALLAVMPMRGRPEAAGFAWAAAIDRWLERHARAVVGLALLAGLAAAASVPYVQFDSDPLDLKDPAKESVRTALELTRDPLATPYGIDILMPSLDEAVALGHEFDALPEVRMTLTLASFVPDDQAPKLDIISQMQLFLGPILDPGTKPPPPTVEADRAAIGQFATDLAGFLAGPNAAALGEGGRQLSTALNALLAQPGGGDIVALRTALLGGFPARIDLLRRAMAAAPLTAAEMPPEIRDAWIAKDGQARLSVFPKGNMRDHAALARFVELVRARAPNATGGPVLILETGRTVSGAFRSASLSAFIAITIVLALILRRFRDVVLVIVPLGLAGLYTLGTTVLFGLAFNYANVIAVPLLMGIGVAFDIYFVMLWRANDGPVTLLQTSTARAVLFSALTTVTAFGSLALSHHAGTASMGVLLIVALGFVLLSTLLVQPALMTVLGRRRERGDIRSDRPDV